MSKNIIWNFDNWKFFYFSYDEFLYQSNKPDFQKDPGWDSLDEQQVYSEQEYEAYKQHELEQQIAHGMVCSLLKIFVVKILVVFS